MDEIFPYLKKCKLCGKTINGNRILCLACQQRRRNWNSLTRWIGSNVLGYPSLEEHEENDIVIAS